MDATELRRKEELAQRLGKAAAGLYAEQDCLYDESLEAGARKYSVDLFDALTRVFESGEKFTDFFRATPWFSELTHKLKLAIDANDRVVRAYATLDALLKDDIPPMGDCQNLVLVIEAFMVASGRIALIERQRQGLD